ncbi:hypothetical protein UlMin_008727 [Ulmus minor]
MAGLFVYGKSSISMHFLGAQGKEALTGGSFAISVANLFGYSIISGLAAGMDGISSQAFGANQLPLMGLTLQRTILFLLSFSLPISLVWLIFSKSFFLLWFDDPTTAEIATTYLRYSIPSFLLLSIIFPLRIFLRAQKLTRPVMINSALSFFYQALITTYIVDRHHLGVRGIALAAAVTDLLTLVSILLYLHYTKVCKETWRGWSSQCFNKWGPIVRQAIPSCVSTCLEWWWYEFMTMLTKGDDAKACMGIIIMTTSLMVGNELGANQPNRAKRSAIIALFFSIFMAVSNMTFAVKTRWTFPKLYSGDGGILSLAAATLPIVGFCELGNCPQTTICGVLRGSARPKLAGYINVASFYGVGLPMSILFAFGMGQGLVGLCYGLLSAQMVCAFLMVIALMRTNWEVQAQEAKQLMVASNNGNREKSAEEIIDDIETITPSNNGNREKSAEETIHDIETITVEE